MALGALVLLDSFLKYRHRDAKEFGLETWKYILGISILTGVFGILVIVEPFKSQIRIITGCTLLCEGLIMCYTLYSKKRCTIKTMREMIRKWI